MPPENIRDPRNAPAARDLNTTWFTLTVPSDPDVLPMVRSLVRSVGKLAGLGDAPCYEAALAAHEACSNAIRHAHSGNPDLSLTVACRALPEGLEICLRDSGPPFDLDAVPELDPTELRMGGRGVYLIRRLMDGVTCSPLQAGGNELRMFKRADPKTKSEKS